jgi:L-ascorbate metabolism protein UlaG (beta-lactamase superfamily)
MQIFWKGHSCFQILTNVNRGNQVKIVIDPFSEKIGLKLPKLEADILLISHEHYDHNNKKGVLGNPFLIEGPGEYEVKGVYIEGIQSFHDQKGGEERGQNTIYTIEAEEMKICHLGDLGQKKLTDEQLEKIGDVDVLMIPIGGVYTISAKEAIEILAQIEPKITIPMHYSIPKLNIKLDSLEKFLKSLGIKKLEPLPKLTIKKRDLSPEEAKIVVLNPVVKI